MFNIIETERELFRFLVRLARGEASGRYPTSFVLFVEQAIAQVASFSDRSDRLSLVGEEPCCPACRRPSSLTLADLIQEFTSCRPHAPYSRALAAAGLEVLGRMERGVTLGLAVEILVDALHLPERGLLMPCEGHLAVYRTTSTGEQKFGTRINVLRSRV